MWHVFAQPGGKIGVINLRSREIMCASAKTRGYTAFSSGEDATANLSIWTSTNFAASAESIVAPTRTGRNKRKTWRNFGILSA
jgi:hypothetical protein